MHTAMEIGRCEACRDTNHLTLGICEQCKARGERWVSLAKKVQSDPAFALVCYNRCENDRSRVAFIRKYGLPEGAQDPRPDAQILPFRRR